MPIPADTTVDPLEVARIVLNRDPLTARKVKMNWPDDLLKIGKDCFISGGHKDEADGLVLKYHYSHRIPANVQLVYTLHLPGGLFGDMGKVIAACYFSIPPTRWSFSVLELSRLVKHDEYNVSLSGLISACCKKLKLEKQHLLVSFADNTQKHHGGIYQACSWNYDGIRDRRMDGVIIDGNFIPGRSCNSIYGTRSPNKLKLILQGSTIEPHYDEGKYLYWKSLTKTGDKWVELLGLKKNEYPKPSLKGFISPGHLTARRRAGRIQGSCK